MNKKSFVRILLAFGMLLFVTACSGKSKESIAKKLEDKVETMSGYKAQAEMTMKTGQEDQVYQLEIWYQKEDFYRVTIMNGQDEENQQTILKNDEGVFVLTPALNKKFKFQTEWPENSSQPYLYQSYVHDILTDEQATFEQTDDYYVFHTQTNYQSNQSLPYQEIAFDKKNYTPVIVKVKDADQRDLVEVKYTNFTFDPQFAQNDFSADHILAEYSAETIAPEEMMQDLTILFPLYTAGAELADKKVVSLEDGERVIMTFTGENNFTLVQEKHDSMPAAFTPKEVEGEMINLGFSIGALSDRAVEWSYNGVEYYLASDDLSKEELIKVAQSVTGKEAK